MTHAQAATKTLHTHQGVGDGVKHTRQCRDRKFMARRTASPCANQPRRATLLISTITLLAAAMGLAGALALAAPQASKAQAKKPHLPYVTVDHPQFIPASEAVFLNPSDILIGVTDGKTSKAYPAAILAQHGVVQDQAADGPIAVTW